MFAWNSYTIYHRFIKSGQSKIQVIHCKFNLLSLWPCSFFSLILRRRMSCNPNIFATWCHLWYFKLWVLIDKKSDFEISWFTPSGCKDKWVGKFEFVWQKLSSFISFYLIRNSKHFWSPKYNFSKREVIIQWKQISF